MQNSHFYLEQMNHFNKMIEEAKNDRTIYESLYLKLKQLLNGLPEIKSDLVGAENCYKNGGYIDSDGTFDKGKLIDIYSNLESVIENINFIMNQIPNKISFIDNNVTTYRNSYEIASSNYKKACSDEVGG